MGSTFSLLLYTPLSLFLLGSKKKRILSSHDTISDEDAIALLSNIPSLDRLGYIDERGRGASVWRVAPNIVAKHLLLPCEIFMMDLAYSQTSIPIPRILKRITYRGGTFLLMEYVDGSDLYHVWPTLSLWRRIQVAWTLRGYVHQLRAVELPSKVIPGPFDGTGTPLVCEGHHFTEGGSGPFASYTAMTNWYNGRSRLTYVLRNPSITDLSMIPPLTSFFDDSMPLVFTHGDISPTNVRIAKDGSVWLLDWERAGAYPMWFEYANMMAYRSKVHFTEEYDALVWPRGWQWLVPLVAGRYKKQLSFLQRSAVGIAHYKFEGFD